MSRRQGLPRGRPVPSDRVLRLRAAAALAVLALLCIAGALLAERLSLQASLADARAEALRELGEFRSMIEGRLNADVQLMRGLVGYIRMNPDLGQEEFARLAADLMAEGANHIRSMALARDLVITHVHPLPANAVLLGMDYRRNSRQWPMVERTVAENRILVAGPLALVQGGVGLVARYPVTLGGPEGGGALWGIVSTAIDLDRLLDGPQVQALRQRYRLALSGRDGSGAAEPPFWGEPEVQQADPVRLEVVPVSGRWQLAAVPTEGWPRWSGQWPQILAAACGAFLLGAAFVLLLLRHELERARATRLLEQARNEAVAARIAAERANAAKSHFLANMSHDLRTPLNSIIGFSDMIRQRVLGPDWQPRYDDYVRHIHECGGTLVALIDDILDLARIEAETYPLQMEPVAMPDLLREVHALWSLRREGAGRLELALAPDAPAVLLADPRALRRILDNLLSNAVRHAGGAAAIRIDWQKRPGGGARLAVADDGPGIPAAQLPYLTEAFYQGGDEHGRPAEQARRGGGHGLGLSIVRRLAELHGAELEVQSAAGQGATFAILFPPGRVVAAGATLAGAEPAAATAGSA